MIYKAFLLPPLPLFPCFLPLSSRPFCFSLYLPVTTHVTLSLHFPPFSLHLPFPSTTHVPLSFPPCPLISLYFLLFPSRSSLFSLIPFSLPPFTPFSPSLSPSSVSFLFFSLSPHSSFSLFLFIFLSLNFLLPIPPYSPHCFPHTYYPIFLHPPHTFS